MWRYIWLLPIYLLISSIPLIFSVGSNLEYEYSLICGILSLFILPLSAALTPRDLIPGQSNQFDPNIRSELFLIVSSFIIFLIPGFFLFATRACKCSFSGFLFWMLLEFFPISVLAHLCYENILRLKLKYDLGLTRSILVAGFHYLSLILIALISVFCIWWFPQKRINSYVLGFIHGAIYDPGISVGFGVFLKQISYLFLSAFLLTLVWYKKEGIYKFCLFCFGILTLIGYCFCFFLPDTALGKKSLDRLIPYTLSESDFEIHYSDKDTQKSSSGLIYPAPQTKKLMIEVGFHIRELKQILKLDKIKKVHIYLYPDAESKKLWLGGRFTDITDVKGPSVHIIISPNMDWHNTLRHELVHALSSNFAFWGLGFHPNMVFTEGLATALAPSFSDIDQTGIVASIVSQKGFDIKELFSLNFWKKSSSNSYYVAGSLIKYIIDHYGIDKIKELYSGKSWKKVFSDQSENIILAWKKEVLKDFNLKEYELISKSVLKHKGVLEERCPHSKYDYRQNPDQLFIRLRQPLDWDCKSNYWPWRRSLDPTDPYSLFRLYNQQAWELSKEKVIPESKVDSLIQEFDADYRSISSTDQIQIKSVEDIDLLILRADILRLKGSYSTTLEDLNLINQKIKDLGLLIPNQNLRSLTARLLVESLPLSLVIKQKWRNYLAGWSKIPSYTSSEDWILSYLRVKNPNPSKEEVKNFTKEILSLMLLKPLRKDLDPSFYEEFFKMLAAKFMIISDYSQARYCFLKAKSYSKDPGALAYYDEHLRRLEYYSESKSRFKKQK